MSSTKHLAELRDLVDSTLWVDTHEHIVEEADRVQGRLQMPPTFLNGDQGRVLPDDWTALLQGAYVVDDLLSSGMMQADLDRLLGTELGPAEKWLLVEPYLRRCRQTGYGRCLDLTTENLVGLRLSRETCEEIDVRLRALRQSGFYRDVFRIAGIEHCHVNSIVIDPYQETAQPDILRQDISILGLTTGRHPYAEQQFGIEVGSLEDYCQLIDAVFERYGPYAVAAKTQWAYNRELLVEFVSPERARAAFDTLRSDTADAQARRAIEDYLFARCVTRATEHGLPVKLHTGYMAGTNRMPLRRVHENAIHVSGLLQQFPDTTFVLMHIGWPYDHEYLALAKHHSNAYIDLCWAWILAPRSTTDFLQAALTTVPSSKLLCFGGDFMTVESTVGHARLARNGLVSALAELIDGGWLEVAEAVEFVPRLMRDNARELFPDRQASPLASTEASASHLSSFPAQT